jgi:adenine deaminase
MRQMIVLLLTSRLLNHRITQFIFHRYRMPLPVGFLNKLPKAELHLHIEGTLEPEFMFELSQRNHVLIPYNSVSEVREAYSFHNLQSFLDIYYAGASVLLKREDFAELLERYARRAHQDGVVHAEYFFDPQTHLERGVAFDVMFEGFCDGMATATKELGMTFKVIMSFLRHLPEESAFETLEVAKPFLDRIDGVGLDSSEVGNPPEKFARVFEACKKLGLRRVAHAGEEGPPSYIWDSLNILDVCRIDHGVATPKDPALYEHVIKTQMPLTTCPCSNVCLRVFKEFKDLNIIEMLRAGVCVTVNSDDPAYFGGYLTRNFEVLEEVGMTAEDAAKMARNSFIASWLGDDIRAHWIARVDEVIRHHKEFQC